MYRPVPQAALNGYQLDKAHKFAATLFDECERLAKVPESYIEPEPRPYAPGENLLVSGSESQA
jgi:translation initiation factor 3 subunit B